MATTATLGVDPGGHGAFAWLDTDGQLIDVADMPVLSTVVAGKNRNHVDWAAVGTLLLRRKVVHVWVEKVHSMPSDGGTQAFNFGQSYGVILGALGALGLPHTLVTPQAWQKSTQTPKGKDGSRMRAAQLFPDSSHLFARVKDDGRADAALIAAHGYAVQPVTRSAA